MKTFAAVFAVLALAACDASTNTYQIDAAKMSYSQDKRTGLCFGSVGRGTAINLFGQADSFSMTSVPCSPEVLNLVR